MLASVESAIDSKLKSIQEAQDQENLTKTYLQGLVSEMTGKKPTPTLSSANVSAQGTTPPVPTLAQIMERVKKGGGLNNI